MYICSAFWHLLFTPISTELLPGIYVARGNKEYTGDIVQLPVITGLFSMNAISCHSPFLSRVRDNWTINAGCCFCSQKRSGGWIQPRLHKVPRNKCCPTALLLLFGAFTPSLQQLNTSSLIVGWLLLIWLKLNMFNLKRLTDPSRSPDEPRIRK